MIDLMILLKKYKTRYYIAKLSDVVIFLHQRVFLLVQCAFCRNCSQPADSGFCLLVSKEESFPRSCQINGKQPKYSIQVSPEFQIKHDD